MSCALVVDDHESIRVLVGTVLRAAGWRVLTAGSATEAMREAQGSDVDLLITDVSLGDLSGVRLAELVRARWPQAAVLLISGHSPEEIARIAARDGLPGVGTGPRDRVLAKPFGVAEIRAVARSLASDNGATQR